MHRKLTTAQIEQTCRALAARNPHLSGRALRAELRERFGAVGRADRVFAIWRAVTGERPRSTGALHDPALMASAHLVEERAQAAEERANLAEERERAHQDHWASEIHALREQLRRVRQPASESGFVHQRYHEALMKIAQLERQIASLQGRLRAAGLSLVEPDTQT
jgi:hypothetical protein